MGKDSNAFAKNIWEKDCPSKSAKIRCVDMHTAGEPLRIIIDGLPIIKGDSILEKRRYMKKNFDHIRTTLMWEPRGHADQYGCILTPPFSEEADIGTFFLHNEGYSTMCGHAIIAITKAVVDSGIVKMKEPITKVCIETPAGLINANAVINLGEVEKVYFYNVPSFVQSLDQSVNVAGIGKVKYDLAFGGAFYAFVDADSVGVKMTPENYHNLIEVGMKIKREVMNNVKMLHPFEEELNYLYGTIFTGFSGFNNVDSRNVCIFAEGEVDRSPTGTGVSARMAIEHARGNLSTGDSMIIESILGTTFKAGIKEETVFGEYEAVIPIVEGTASYTAKCEFIIEPDDNLKNGFILR